MKKLLLLTIVFIFAIIAPSFIFADTSVTFDVPVKLKKYGEESKDSMGNAAIKEIAEVVEKDGKSHYKLSFKKLEFMGLTGEVTNLFVYNSDENGSRVEAKKSNIGGEYEFEIEFDRDKLKEDRVLIAIWVDAMDALVGGEKGAGEQKAVLKFDWNNAKKSSEKKSNLKDNKYITILVNKEEIKPESPAFIENGRTMVPLRFISEALGEKVEWKSDTKTVVIGENIASLTIGSKEIVLKDRKIEIDSPAIVKDNRTFVPLRVISEILGAKVDWKAEANTVSISK